MLTLQKDGSGGKEGSEPWPGHREQTCGRGAIGAKIGIIAILARSRGRFRENNKPIKERYEKV